MEKSLLFARQINCILMGEAICTICKINVVTDGMCRMCYHVFPYQMNQILGWLVCIDRCLTIIKLLKVKTKVHS